MSGKQRRLTRIIGGNDPVVWLPLDDSLVSGPRGRLTDMTAVLDPLKLANVDAVLCYRGLVQNFPQHLATMPVIENLSASTIRSRHVEKTVVGRVEGAIRRGADAVAYHLNLTDASEHDGLRQLGDLSERAYEYGIPLTVIAYPRRTGPDGTDDNYADLRSASPDKFAELVAHAVRVAVELGADVVKTTYTGTVDSFRMVVAAAYGVPVLVGGGPAAGQADETMHMAKDAVAAGARGVCFGRRVFDAADPLSTLRAIRATLGRPT